MDSSTDRADCVTCCERRDAGTADEVDPVGTISSASASSSSKECAVGAALVGLLDGALSLNPNGLLLLATCVVLMGFLKPKETLLDAMMAVMVMISGALDRPSF